VNAFARSFFGRLAAVRLVFWFFLGDDIFFRPISLNALNAKVLCTLDLLMYHILMGYLLNKQLYVFQKSSFVKLISMNCCYLLF